jgi:hypothetical protein
MLRPKPAKEFAYPNARTEKMQQKMKDRISKDKNGQLVTAPKNNGGGSANRNTVQLINFCRYRQLSVPKPPLLLAANR